MPQVFWEILLLFALILGNGVFAMTEIAIVSARRSRLEQLAASGDRGAAEALKLLDDPNRLLSTIQVGITLIGTLAGVVGGARFATPLSELLQSAGVADAYRENIALAIVVLAITYLSLTLGELVPKRIAMSNPEGISRFAARPMKRLSWFTSPLIAVLSASTNLILTLVPLKHGNETDVTEDDIRMMIRQGAKFGVLTGEEQDMLIRMLHLDERRASALMTPRRDIVSFPSKATRAEILETIKENRHSRYPVRGENNDEILGMVHLRDLTEAMTISEVVDLAACMSKPLRIPGTTRALALLRRFKTSGIHFAVVQDEFGGVQGVVTLNDLFESIVGGLPEAGEDNEPDVVRREDGSYLLDGSIPIEDVFALFPGRPITEEMDGGFRTLGGFVMAQLDRIPTAGDHFTCGNLRFEVMDMDDRRVDKVLAQVLGEPAAPEPEPKASR
ncbi:MAG: HlyC/CorC family transporter [Candidatus Hydrogenedentes bacterium]|nr:HlyC/CorC family transporter [Candidatus Hydrogenedentota bacterium]